METKKRNKIQGYAGVYYRLVDRPGGRGMEKIYYIRYRRNGRQIEEKVGGQYRDKMTAAKAAGIRGRRIEGLEPSNAEKRATASMLKEAERNRMTIEKIWRQFANAKKDNRSFGDDLTRYELYIEPCLKRKSICEIAFADVEAIRQSLAQAGKAPQTVKHVLLLLKRMLNFALKNGMIDNMPSTIQKMEIPAVDNCRTENLTQKQVESLLKCLDEEKDQVQASIMRLALFTGMRRNAILNLKWEDLDFERGFICLRGEVAKKGRTELIPMNSYARNVLENMPRTASPYVFPSRDGKKPMRNIYTMLRRVREKAGLPDTFRPLHGLRHTFASWLASSGKVTMYELQKLLTHSSPQMTQRYAHLHDSALRKASELAGELFNQGLSNDQVKAR